MSGWRISVDCHKNTVPFYGQQYGKCSQECFRLFINVKWSAQCIYLNYSYSRNTFAAFFHSCLGHRFLYWAVLHQPWLWPIHLEILPITKPIAVCLENQCGYFIRLDFKWAFRQVPCSNAWNLIRYPCRCRCWFWCGVANVCVCVNAMSVNTMLIISLIFDF